MIESSNFGSLGSRVSFMSVINAIDILENRTYKQNDMQLITRLDVSDDR
jgi:hypothetical protein